MSSSSEIELTDNFDNTFNLSASRSESLLSELPLKPDLTLFCPICQIHVDLRLIKEHRAYHSALQTLKYNPCFHPQNVEAVKRRRNNLLRKWRSKAGPGQLLPPGMLQDLNRAYEVIKSDIENSQEEFKRVNNLNYSQINGSSYPCSPSSLLVLGVASDPNHRWKQDMEDTETFIDSFGNSESKCFFGLFDGYHGRCAAETAAKMYHQILLGEMSKFDPTVTDSFNRLESSEQQNCADSTDKNDSTYESCVNIYADSCDLVADIMNTASKNIEKLVGESNTYCLEDSFGIKINSAMRNSHLKLDSLLVHGQGESSRVRWSGCSTLAVLYIQDEKYSPNNGDNDQSFGTFYISNVGNVHAVVVRDRKAITLSEDHTLSNLNERRRIKMSGASVGSIKHCSKVNGLLSTTRGIGNHGDISLKSLVINEAYTTSYSVDSKCQMLILATKGVWEVLSPQEAADLLQTCPPYFTRSSVRASSSVAELLATDESDDISLDSEFSQRRSSEIDASNHDSFSTSTEQLLSHPNVSEDIFKQRLSSESSSQINLYPDFDQFSQVGETAHEETAKYLAERLVKAALLAGSTSNISLMVILLPGFYEQ